MASMITSLRTGRAALLGILTRLGLAWPGAALVPARVHSEHALRGVLASSGGKFTDSLEREAHLRSCDDWAAF